MAQLSEWAELLELEPEGYEIDETRFGMMASLIAKMNGIDLSPTEYTTRRPEPGSPAAEALKVAVEQKKSDDVASEIERLLSGAERAASTPPAKL